MSRSLLPALAAALGLALLSGAAATAQLDTTASVYFDQIILGQALEADSSLGQALAAGDFDGDGKDDLAIGAPLQTVGGDANAGAVYIVYGASGGLTAAGAEFWTQDTLILDTAEAGDTFGAALAAGDFDGDGYDDLAIGVPGEASGGFAGSGAVAVLYGSATGLQVAGNELLDQTDVSATNPEAGDAFGSSLAVGDFDLDGYDDLAIGSPFETWNATSGAGAAHIIYGDADGFEGNDALTIVQGELAFPGTPEALDYFGWALAAGNFVDDEADDLAIGAIGEDSFEGEVLIAVGNVTAGVTTETRMKDLTDCSWAEEAGAQFGWSLASGNLDGDEYDDLLAGAPGRSNNGKAAAGVSCAFLGGFADLTEGGSMFQHTGTNEHDEAGDGFGWALAAGDFDFDGYDDAVIGIPEEDLLFTDEGLVTILPGMEMDPPDLLSPTHLTQNSAGITGVGQQDDQFGEVLATGDFDGNGVLDLAIAIPGESGSSGAVVAVPAGLHVILADGFESGDFRKWSDTSP